jgi:hypothetical protein
LLLSARRERPRQRSQRREDQIVELRRTQDRPRQSGALDEPLRLELVPVVAQRDPVHPDDRDADQVRAAAGAGGLDQVAGGFDVNALGLRTSVAQ